MVRLDNWHNTCTIGVIGYRRVLVTRFSDESTVFILYGLKSMGLKCLIQHWKLFWKPCENHVEKVSRKPCINR